MLQRLSGPRIANYLQKLTVGLAVLFAVAWFGVIAFMLVKGAFEIGGLFIMFTLLIALLAYANERPE